MDTKKSFILYCDFKPMFDLLDYEDKGRLIEAIFKHECGETVKALPPMVTMAFASIQPHLIRNKEKWEDIRKKRAEAGRKGGMSSKQTQANEANACFAKHNVNVNGNENVNANDNVNDIVNVFYSAFGREPTAFEERTIELWISSFGYQAVEEAFELAEPGGDTLDYVKKILFSREVKSK